MAMAYPSPEILMSIIDVNLGLAAGLRKKPAQQQENTLIKVENTPLEIRG
jgi:hypothetical protein